MTKKIFVLVVLFFNITINAQEQNIAEEVKINVSGLVCDFCARGIESNFKELKEVDKVKISLEDSLITLLLKDKKTINDKILKKIINDNGISVNKIKRNSK